MAALEGLCSERAGGSDTGFGTPENFTAHRGEADEQQDSEQGPAPTDDLEDLKERWAREQEDLKKKVTVGDNIPWSLCREDQPPKVPLRLVGGLDISFIPSEDDGEEGARREQGLACLVVLSYPELTVLYEDFEEIDLQVPYASGFLGFRECPAFQVLLFRVKGTPMEPQVLLVDGFGILHTRGCGSASHLGVLEDMPTVGVGKSLVCIDGLRERAVRQQCAEELSKIKSCPASERPEGGNIGTPHGEQAASLDLCLPLVGSSGATWGMAVCKQGTTRPVFVSVGHRLSLATATQLVLSCMHHRVPEPIRQADLKSRQTIRERLLRC